MKIEIGEYEFYSEPTTKPGRVFMVAPNGEGTEIEELKLQEVLGKLFQEIM